MISLLSGKIIYKDGKRAMVERQGLGFDVFLSAPSLEKVKVGEERDFYTFLFVGEKNIELYGFLSFEELELFKALKHVPGIGPKTAMSLVVCGSLEKLKEILEKGEMPPEVKGVGKKKLQKILLEISGQIKEMKNNKPKKKDEVYQALSSLGFSREEIDDAVSKIPKDVEDVEERIKQALKFLGR
ncbi:MAG: Holliday junction branch migration protein RuvA [Candidatus Pacebacteria bacterium]|nr:Holliday junction branch migration protein RuvA [Candidatus Paceibacterota bacterium]